MQYRKEIALIGALMLFIGPFFPFMSAPLLGDLTYFRNGTGDGVIVFILAAVAIVLALYEKFILLIPTAIAAGVTITYTAITLSSRLIELQKAKPKSSTFSETFADNIANAVGMFVQIQWGMPFLLIAVMVILYASIEWAEKVKLAANCPHCGGTLPVAQSVCNHCLNPVLWLRDKPRKPSKPTPIQPGHPAPLDTPVQPETPAA
jgi:hypothetical protein